MVMSLGPSHEIASAIASRMYLANEAEVGKQVKCTIDSNQSDARVFLAYLVANSCGCQVVVAGSDYI
jgi:hypothetical protein